MKAILLSSMNKTGLFMNNFTKEELEYLEKAVQFHILEDYQQNPALNILNKIKALIKDYNGYKYEALDCMEPSALSCKYNHE